MKKTIQPLVNLFILITFPAMLLAQSNFSSEEYKLFIENNKNLTASDLLSNHPPKTTYYTGRLYPTDVNQVPWFDTLNQVYQFTDQEKELLSQNHFMVTERISNTTWLSSLVNIYNNDLPLFISTDFVLYTLHNAYDNILLRLEWQLLEPNLTKLLRSMYEQYPDLYNKYKDDDRFSDALADVDLYVSIAYSLLLDESYLPLKHTPEKFTEILQLVDQEQLAFTTLFTETRTRKIDFSQFTPRGHYTRAIYTPSGERTLEDYFRAMMWLGRIDFLMTAPPSNPWEPDWTREELTRMQVSAMLLNELLFSCEEKEFLDMHEKIITFLVGPDDNLTPEELKQLSDNAVADVSDLFDINHYNQFTDSLNASDDYGQKIMSNFFYVDPYSSDPGSLPVSFKLLGQKFLIDSYVTSEVVYDRIISNGVKIYRGMPDPLDVMAVLGNEDAMPLLEDELETYKYAYKISNLKYLVDSYDPEFWQQSLYNSWLNAIRKLNPPESSDNLPYFMQTCGWHLEKLNSQLTSWAELRHDNLLYAKQSYTGGTGCSYPYTYVEPNPEFYQAVSGFAQEAIEFFQDNSDENSLDCFDPIVNYYTTYSEIIENFQTISEKELAGESLNNSEITFLKTMINEFMVSGPSVTGWFNDLFFDAQSGLDPDYLVADIHTQPTDEAGNIVGNVYHVGNGHINTGVFIAPNPVNPKQLMAFAGPVASFHYAITDNFKRYTDEEWKEIFFLGEDLPLRPDWVYGYLANKEGNTLAEGRRLDGIENTEKISLTLTSAINDIDYLLAFPNPASDVINLRFMLNTKKPVTVEIYDITGSLISQPYHNLLAPAEHNIPLDVSEYKAGVYYIRLIIGNDILQKEFTVN